MFRLMLNAHDRLSIPGETWFLSELMDALRLTGPLTDVDVQTARQLIQGHWRWEEWGVEDDRLEDALRDLDTPTLADVIDTTFRLTVEPDGDAQWGDKTPGYVTEVPRLHTVFPEARFLHVIRDGRDVCLSLKRTGWHGESTWGIARYWADAVSSACRAGRSLPGDQYMEISYERLVQDTENVLREVCEFLGVGFQRGMLDFHETATNELPDRTRQHHSKTHRAPRSQDVRRWEREQPPLQRVIFEAFAGDALAMAGYDPTVRSGRAPVRMACRALDRVANFTYPVRRRLGIHFPGWRRSL